MWRVAWLLWSLGGPGAGIGASGGSDGLSAVSGQLSALILRAEGGAPAGAQACAHAAARVPEGAVPGPTGSAEGCPLTADSPPQLGTGARPASGAISADAPSVCVVPEGRVTARVTWRGGEVVARDGALEVDGRRLTPCDGLPGPYPTALTVAGDALYVGFRAAGLHRFDGRAFVRVEGLPADAVSALATRAGQVFAGTGLSGLWTVDGLEARRFRHWVLGKRPVSALYVARDGALHVGAGPYGWWRARGAKVERVERGTYAGCFVEAEGRVRAFAPGGSCGLGVAATASGLPSNHVSALAIFDGALHVGTFDAGLARRLPDGRFAPVAGAPRFVNALLPDGARLWIATPKGLFVLRGGRVRRAPVALPSDHVNGLAAGPDGTIWVATSKGLAGVRADGVRVIGPRHGLPSRIVYAVAVSTDGAVWAGTAGGAARIAADGVRTYTQANGALPHDWVNALLPEGDGVLAGTYDAGVARRDAEGGRVLPGLGDAWVNPAGLTRAGGALWVSTLGGGLWRAAGDRVTRVHGLPADDVTAVALLHGALWIGTRGGLAHVPSNPHGGS